jgi:cytochrome P450
VKRVEALRPFVQTIVDRLIDAMIVGPRPVEFVQEFAQPLPTEVITHLLGVPYEDHEVFQRATRTQFGRTPRRAKSGPRSTS